MVTYNDKERAIIDQFNRFTPNANSNKSKYEQYLESIPFEERRYKCHTCYAILNNSDLVNGHCPCGEKHLVPMCTLDHNGCGHDITSGIHICPVCGEPVCGQCGDHSVFIVSRVTGYLSNINSWNAGKRAELIDRVRTDPEKIGQLL